MASPVSAVGALYASTGAGNNLLPVTTHAVGNALVMSVKVSSSTITTVGVVGGGAVGWQRIAGPTQDTEGTVNTHELWLGTVVSPGDYTSMNEVTLTFSATVVGTNVDISAQEFTAFSPFAVWARQDSQDGLVDNASSTTVTFPSLTAVGTGQVYVGHARCPAGSGYTVPLNSGSVVQKDAAGNPYLYSTNLSAGATAPTVTSAVATASDAMGVIVFATIVPSLAQFLPYGEGTYGAPRTYGFPYFTQFTVEPMTASSFNYTTILVQWQQPQGAIGRYRLVSNRYGFPIDENDGSVLMDSTTYFGSQYADQQVVPGTYHYYGFYIQDIQGAWHRAGFVSCLATNGFNSGTWLFNNLPAFFQNTNGAFSVDPTGDPFLIQFLNVIGWGLDYLKTQYNVLANHLNDPMFIPLDDLYNLAAELGMPFQTEIPASTMRKGVKNWTHVCQERGTSTGIVNNITLLTDYGVDLQIGYNIMLEQDQSNFMDPAFPPWNANISYNLNEYVLFGQYVYKCKALSNEGNAPTGTTAANTWWTVVQDTDDPFKTLFNPNTVGSVNTWEAIYPSVSNGIASAGSLINGIGVVNPLNGSNNQANDLRIYNKGGSPQSLYARSLSRVPADLGTVTTTFAPDAQQAVLDGIPVPFTTPASVWQPALRYSTNSIVTFNNIPFIANRASTGATPPSVGVPLNQNYALTAATITPWTGGNNGTVTLSSAFAYQGTNSALLTPDGVTANPQILSNIVSVQPLSLETVGAWVFVPAGWSTCAASIRWIDQFGATVSTSVGTSVSVAASTWTQLTVTATAPLTAASAQLIVQMNGTPPGTTLLYGDLMGLSSWATAEWTPLSKDSRLHLMLSAYVSQSLSQVSNFTSPVTAQAEWYDLHGKYLSRVGRTPSSGSASYLPANLVYDSFTTGFGAYLAGRNTDTDDQTWVEDVGTFLIGEFAGGSAYPGVLGQRSIAVVNGPANGWVALTLSTQAQAPQTSGLVFRYQDDNNFWFATWTTLWLKSGGSWTSVGNYSIPFQPGDRLYAQLGNGGNNNIAIYRNGQAAGNQVLSITNPTLATATKHGIGVDTP